MSKSKELFSQQREEDNQMLDADYQYQQHLNSQRPYLIPNQKLEARDVLNNIFEAWGSIIQQTYGNQDKKK
jgi:hypothetical protein